MSPQKPTFMLLSDIHADYKDYKMFLDQHSLLASWTELFSQFINEESDAKANFSYSNI